MEVSRLIRRRKYRTKVLFISQWRRSVVKVGNQDQSGQAVKLFQVPRKISFTFHF